MIEVVIRLDNHGIEQQAKQKFTNWHEALAVTTRTINRTVEGFDGAKIIQVLMTDNLTSRRT